MKKYFAEFIGCFVLVLLGCGSYTILNTTIDNLGYSILIISFAFGLSFIAMFYAIKSISGCHINPAVSLAMWINNKLSTKDFMGYVIAQCIGAICASSCLAFLTKSTKSLGANGFGSLSSLHSSMLIAIIVEILLAFIFVFTILNVIQKKEYSHISGLIIGLTLVLVHIFGIPFTGTSVNPARSLGPALITGGKALNQVWVFILSPLAGALIAVLIYKILSNDNHTKKKK